MTSTASSAQATPVVTWESGDLVMTRTFDAPREMVFRAWTEPGHFARWFGPHGSAMQLVAMDARPGGALHFRHSFPDYPDVWVAGTFREVRAPELVSFEFHFSDPSGARVDRPGFPAGQTIAATFAEEGGRTRVTVRQIGIVEDQGEVQGWTEGLDRLAALLAAG